MGLGRVTFPLFHLSLLSLPSSFSFFVCPFLLQATKSETYHTSIFLTQMDLYTVAYLATCYPPTYLPVHLSIQPPTHRPTHLPTSLSTYPPIHLTTHSTTHPPTHLFAHVLSYLPTYLPTYLSTCITTYPLTFIPTNPPAYRILS